MGTLFLDYNDGSSGSPSPGIEILSAYSAKVSSINTGIVSDIFSQDQFGNILVVDHTDFSSIYGNLTDLVVSIGEEIQSGQSLWRADEGRLAEQGMVFFGTFDSKGKLVNPFNYIRKNTHPN